MYFNNKLMLNINSGICSPKQLITELDNRRKPAAVFNADYAPENIYSFGP